MDGLETWFGLAEDAPDESQINPQEDGLLAVGAIPDSRQIPLELLNGQ